MDLQSVLLGRLGSDPKARKNGWDILVLAALEGPETLEAQILDKAQRPGPQHPSTADGEEPVIAYLRSISVEGFRGIGPTAKLELTPGPGLTLVVGRNGCGKSSFAEALELLLTGDTFRWSQRSKIWRDGWRNLHHLTTGIEAEFLIEGKRGAAIASTRWTENTGLENGIRTLQVHGKPKSNLASLGWTDALVTYRPFLSYNELGSMLDEGPAKLHDALSSILGLDDLVAAQEALAEARKTREKALKQAGEALEPILEQILRFEDARARVLAMALGQEDWGLDEVASILAQATTSLGSDREIQLLRQLVALAAPEPREIAETAKALREADQRLKATAGTLAVRSKDLSEILDQVLRFHERHGDGDCPVCGRPAALDKKWHEHQARDVARLRELAKEATTAQQTADAARRRALGLPAPSADVVGRAAEVDLDGGRAVTLALDAWRNGLDTADLEQLAANLEKASAPLRSAVSELRGLAEAEMQRREAVWQPLAARLTVWLDLARHARAAAAQVPQLKQAESWLKKAAADLRNERFIPMAERAQRIWEQLRQQSHVSLGEIHLRGEGNRRHVELDVTVDGVAGAALGVMSQGEINALALSLFIPRATLDESPFRFVVIDDPVQSMDPARVDGLARVLESAARDRQVVVFTHDDRLPAAVRRLNIEATVLEVTRREGSFVEVRTARDPVGRYIEDAMAVAYTDALPPEAARRVIPGLCRLAVEAACMEATRRRRIGRGDSHGEVEKLLEGLTGTKALTALALFDDHQRAGDVLSRLHRERKEFADVFRQVNEGAHELQPAAIVDVVRGAERLARWVQGQK